VPDDLVTKYVNGKVKARMFVLRNRCKCLFSRTAVDGVTVPKQRIVYAKIRSRQTTSRSSCRDEQPDNW
jgi:hypothetical protein